MMLRLFAKNNNLQYIDPTDDEINFTYDFYYDYLKKSSKQLISIAYLFMIFPAFSLIDAIISGDFFDFFMWAILTSGIDVWLIICAKRYKQYIKDIKAGRFQIAYVNIQMVGLYTIRARRHSAKVGCLRYDAPDKNGDIVTWTARIPDKIAKEYEKSNKYTPKLGFVISMKNQMESMGVVWEAQTE